MAGHPDRVLLGLHTGLGQLLRLLDGPFDGVDVVLEQVPRQMEATFLCARPHLQAAHEHLGRVLLHPQGLLHRGLDRLFEYLFPARRLVSVVHGVFLREIALAATSRVGVAPGVGYDAEPVDKATKPFIRYARASVGYATASLRIRARFVLVCARFVRVRHRFAWVRLRYVGVCVRFVLVRLRFPKGTRLKTG